MALLLLLFACRGSNTSGSNSATPLKFLLMVASPDSSAVVPAVDQTLEKINGDTSVLPGHHLEYILSENQVAICMYRNYDCRLLNKLLISTRVKTPISALELEHWIAFSTCQLTD